jgi:hypothetical protein
MIESVLGLEPDAFSRRLRIRRPRLPDFVNTLTLDGLTVGTARAHLVFKRTNGETLLDDARVEGDLHVETISA